MRASSAQRFIISAVFRLRAGYLAVLLAVGLCGALLLTTLTSVSSQTNVFGPKTYFLRASGPSNYTDNFNASNPDDAFTITVQNGNSSGGRRIGNGRITLNQQVIALTSQVGLVQRAVNLQARNTLSVRLTSGESNSFVTVIINRAETPPPTAPVVTIISPRAGTVFNAQPVMVEGTVSIFGAQVMVNGVAAAVSGGRFVAGNVPLLRDGNQIISAVATIPGGGTGQDGIAVALDTLPPMVVIDSPSANFITADETIAVAGIVSDVIAVTPTVTVNGVNAAVSNSNFIALGVPLNPGVNQVTATARDGVGNQSTNTITITRAEQPGQRVLVETGQGQSGPVNTLLPTPLTAKVVDGNGNPVANREVTFQVARGDGTLKNSPPAPGQTGQRSLIVRTDAAGLAAVQFTLGTRTGAGNNRVQAGVVGGLSPLEFCATATGGVPDRITIIPMSNQQMGVVDQPLADQFAAVVSDAMGNPVPGVPVTFTVTEGGGNLDGNASLMVNTGADGKARALLTLGPLPGTQNNVVRASFQGQTGPPVSFVASGRATGAPAGTTFTGTVLDNGDRPLRNARAVILGTNSSALTDAQGRFTIMNVTPGAQRLFIEGGQIIDTLGRIFPDLEFDVNVVSGAENSLPFPIFLPPLATDPMSVATITGPVTTAVVLRMPGVPEGTLTLLPGTVVTNQTGPASPSNPITVRLSRVNNDRVPMPPPNGSLFMLAGTVQPAGTHFTPPAKICVPNAGMPPGAQVDIFSFDHDVGQFLSIGPATVSEDGATLCSNPGFGISKAGWWGCSPPRPPTTESKNCRVVSVTANPNPVCVGQDVVITATTDPGNKTVTWGGNLGDNPQITGNTLRTRYSTPGAKTVTATCEQSSKSVTVNAVAVTTVALDRPANRMTFCVGETGDFTAQLSMPIAGVNVIFEVINLMNNSVFSSTTRTTNSQGKATVTLEATTVGQYRIQARCGMENPAPFYGPIQVVRLLEAQAKRNDEMDDVFAKAPGKFCVNDRINGRAMTDPAMTLGPPVKWELRLTGFFSDTVKARGDGSSFADQLLDTRGDWQIVFYCDTNENGQFDNPLFGSDEPNVRTDEFEVQDVNTISLTVVRHVDTPFTNAQVDAFFAAANESLRKRNRLDDVRCCVQLQRSGAIGTFGQTGNPPGTPPSMIQTEADQNAVFAVMGNIKIVSAINFCGRIVAANGCTNRGQRNTILVPGATAGAWAHEFGHAQGIVGDYMDPALSHRIMYFQDLGGNTVDMAECNSFRRQ